VSYACESTTRQALGLQKAMMDRCREERPGCDPFAAMWEWWKRANIKTRDINSILDYMTEEIFRVFAPMNIEINGQHKQVFVPRENLEAALAQLPAEVKP
jgi:hypothetical protein